MEPVEKRSVGRPTDYSPNFNEEAFKLTLLGLTDVELAKYFDVAERTLNDWKVKYPAFLQSIREGKEEADANVSDKLYNRAKGMEWTENVPMKIKEVYFDDAGRRCEKEKIELVPVRKSVPPDTQALQFWLKNRRSQNWREKTEVNHQSGDKPLGDVLLEMIDKVYHK